ncbi:hypothetical protein HJ58_003878 [Salmonella enterica subsp. enterica serovar Give]|nr:hypothetical protein [Salmonella enterica subsp. enterica serovar Give]
MMKNLSQLFFLTANISVTFAVWSVQRAVKAVTRHHCGDNGLYMGADAGLKTGLLAAIILALAGQNNAEQQNSLKEKILH